MFYVCISSAGNIFNIHYFFLIWHIYNWTAIWYCCIFFQVAHAVQTSCSGCKYQLSAMLSVTQLIIQEISLKAWSVLVTVQIPMPARVTQVVHWWWRMATNLWPLELCPGELAVPLAMLEFMPELLHTWTGSEMSKFFHVMSSMFYYCWMK